MKSRILFTLPLAASLMLPAMAQQAPADNQQPCRHVAEQLATVVIFLNVFEPDCQLRPKHDRASAA